MLDLRQEISFHSRTELKWDLNSAITLESECFICDPESIWKAQLLCTVRVECNTEEAEKN